LAQIANFYFSSTQCYIGSTNERIVIIIFQNDLMYAVPGGLIGVGTKIDPTLCRADRMVGQVLGSVGGLPDIFTELEVSYYLVISVSVV